MAMIGDLVIEARDAGISTRLSGLHQINIICGRNNSGKSTLLRLITNPETSAIGRTLAAEDAAVFFEQTVESGGWRNMSGSRERSHYRDIVAAYLSGEFYSTFDEIRFFDGLSKIIAGHPILGRYSLPSTPRVLQAYRDLFPVRPKTVILSPKRNLDIHAALASGQQVNWSGGGVLNALFYAKNLIRSAQNDNLFDQVRSGFSDITSGFSFDISLNQSNEIHLSFISPDGQIIHPDNSGLGLRDLLVIIYFALIPDHQLLCIEEPENHLHPELQRKLLGFLKLRTTKQYFLTTHSSVFLDTQLVDRIFLTTFADRVNVDDATSRAVILNELGYAVTDNLTSDLVILVEGPSDAAALQGFLSQTTLVANRGIKIWPLGGDIMDQVDLSVFAERYTIRALIDQDPGSDKVRKRFISNCEAFNIPVTRLERYSIENYFPLRALRSVYKGQVPNTLTELDPNQPVEAQVQLGLKRNNAKLARETRLDELKGTDLYAFLEEIAATVGAELLESAPRLGNHGI